MLAADGKVKYTECCKRCASIDRFVRIGQEGIMDIQKLIAQAVKVLTENEDMIRAFNKNPGKTLEKILGMDLPDEQINAIVAGVKAKMGLDDAMEMAGKLMGLFGRK